MTPVVILGGNKMGYTTNFTGRFELDRELTDELYEYLKTFATVRHMRRNNEKIRELFPDWQKHCLCMGLGLDGEYFVRDDGDFGQSRDDSVIDYNMPARSQPGLWCQWVPTSDKKHIEWNGCKKFYSYIEWLYYIIGNFLEPNNYFLNGEVKWQGENSDDYGTIIVTNNEITIISDEILNGIKCPICGSVMDFDVDSHIFICAFCGTKAFIPKEVKE